MAKLRILSIFVLASTFLFASTLTAQVATPSVRIVSPISERQLVTLKGTVHPLANAANDRGVAPDSLPLQRMQLMLKRSASQEAALKELIREQHTPGSANYHKWLTPAEFGKQFGPSDQDLATVQTWLAGHGFSVDGVNPGRQTIAITGSVAQLRTAFHTQIHEYMVQGSLHYANASDPQIPAALAPVVGGFVSLNNFPVRSYARSLGKATYNPTTGQVTPQWTKSSSSGNFYVLSPQDFGVQYDLPNSSLNSTYSGTTYDGTGQTIAIVNEANINVDLVNQFRSLFGLPYNPPQVIIDGNDPGIDGINNPDGSNGASVEAYLDVEWAGAVAPKATIDLVIAADTALENGLVLAAQRAVYSNIAPIISVSFGSCESSMGSFNQSINALWEQAAAQGQTVMVSTGDSGSAGCDDPNSQDFAKQGQAVNGIASTPYNVAVGGTDFYYTSSGQLGTYWNTTASNSTPAVSIKQRIPEQPWNESQFGLNINSYYALTGNQYTSIAGGSGGASNAALCSGNTYNSSGICTSTVSGYAKPSWQVGVGVPTDSVRDTPDVSLFASSGINNSFYPICASDGDCQTGGSSVQIYGVGGTSASAPAFAGIMALVNQKTGQRQGQADTILYPLAAQYPAAFHDVTVGSNSVPCSYSATASSNSPNCIAVTSPIVLNSVTEGQIGNTTTKIPEYNAGAGYDLATGLGTIDAAQLVAHWSDVKLASTTTTMTPSSTSFAHGASITISGNVTATSGTPTGTVALMTDNTDTGQQAITTFTLSGGAYSGAVTTLPGGTYNIWVQYGGDATNAASKSAMTQVTVSSEASAVNLNLFSGSGYSTCGGSTPGTSVDYGTQIQLSALVAPSSQATAVQKCATSSTSTCPVYGTPSGTVTFTDSSTTLNTALLDAVGDAEYNAPFSVGAHSVTASYSGDQSYSKSSATCSIPFTVVQDQPQLFVGASNQTSATNTFQVVGNSNQPTVLNVILENNAQYTVNANSSSGAVAPVAVAPPTGTVSITGFPSGVPTTATLSAGVDPYNRAQAGVATITVPAGTPANTYTVTLAYSGDTNYTKATGQGTVQISSDSGTVKTVTTASMSGSISPNSVLTISGTVTAQSGSAAPSGYIMLFSSGSIVNYYNLTTPSSGTISTFSFNVDSSTLFQGANFATVQYIPATSSAFQISATTLNSGSAISNPLSDYTLIPLTANVPLNISSGTKSVTSTISLASMGGFSGNVNLTCTAAVGVTCSLPATAALSAGGSTTAALTITAPADTANQTYNVLITAKDEATGEYVHTAAVQAVVTGSPAGSSSFALSNSGNLSLDASASVNNSGTSTITVTPVGSSGFTGSVALSCAVTPSGSNIPTCSVTTPVALTGAAAGTATLTVNTTASTAAGTYTATVTGTSGAITMTTPVTVSVGQPSFTLPASNSLTINISSPGATTGNTATIPLTPTNGFSGTVNLTCAVSTSMTSANGLPSCTLGAGSTAGTSSSTSVNLSGTTPQTVTLAVITTAATASLDRTEKLFWPTTGSAVLALVFLFWGAERRRRWLAMLGVLLLLVSAAGMSACGGGGGSSSGSGGSSSNTGTTAGAYTVLVTATTGSGASAISQTTKVAVNVQ